MAAPQAEHSKVTAIVVTFNGKAWLDRCFGSLLNSTLPVRVIAVDNGSTDGTPDLLRDRYPSVELVATGRNLGFGAANNIGMAMALQAGAEHIFLLNQDAWIRPDTIELLLHAAASGSRFGILSPIHLNGNGDALDLAFSNYIVPEKCPGLYSDHITGTRRLIYEAQFVNAAAWLMTRRCLERVGGFSPTFFHYWEDDNYVDRLHYHGLAVGVVPGSFIQHDRAARPIDPFMEQVRRHVLLASDPAADHDLKAQRNYMLRQAIGQLLVMDLPAYRRTMRLRNALKDRDAESIRHDRDHTRKQGTTFLKIPSSAPKAAKETAR